MLKWISNVFNVLEINKLKEENKRLQNIINRLEIDINYMVEKVQKFSNFDSLAAHVLRGGINDRHNY